MIRKVREAANYRKYFGRPFILYLFGYLFGNPAAERSTPDGRSGTGLRFQFIREINRHLCHEYSILYTITLNTDGNEKCSIFQLCDKLDVASRCHAWELSLGEASKRLLSFLK